ncbi:MAG: TrmJ/YjtD family RNA methyltransferase [Elusimicrobiota bacterium]|jgi:tRNA/rRNA methyltransferase|nr:TrmJ/YjtD family RNA methyltransferase [Elusimicrobiota bacterium]
MKISIVLVRPRNPQNIGAAARAMGNFGLSDLRIVAPHKPVWQEVVSAVGAEDILKNAALYDDLPSALADANLVLATTALKNRRVNQNIINLPTLNEELKEENPQKIAIVFGPEKTGLTQSEIALAHKILNIPTSKKTPSINLAQAVILCCYELSKNKALPKYPNKKEEPTFEETQILINNLLALLDKLALPPTLNKKILTERFRNIASLRAFSKQNIFFINSIVAKINKKIK